MSFAATLDKRATIQAQVQEQDEIGQPVGEWQDVKTVWCSVRFPSGREFIASEKEAVEIKASFQIRAPDFALDESMRILFGGDVYGIHAALPYGKSLVNIIATKVK